MNIFEWIKDIEQVYDDLINNAKEINLNDIEKFREEQRIEFEKFLDKKNELVNNALINLSKDVDSQIKVFRETMDKAINKIEKKFKKNIQNLQKLIITETGLDF
jgi:hypothetical protein